MPLWLWDCSPGGWAEADYKPYDGDISEKIEAAYLADGADKFCVKISDTHEVTKTRKGFVQRQLADKARGHDGGHPRGLVG